jgi:hypothetical protein
MLIWEVEDMRHVRRGPGYQHKSLAACQILDTRTWYITGKGCIGTINTYQVRASTNNVYVEFKFQKRID